MLLFEPRKHFEIRLGPYFQDLKKNKKIIFKKKKFGLLLKAINLKYLYLLIVQSKFSTCESFYVNKIQANIQPKNPNPFNVYKIQANNIQPNIQPKNHFDQPHSAN